MVGHSPVAACLNVAFAEHDAGISCADWQLARSPGRTLDQGHLPLVLSRHSAGGHRSRLGYSGFLSCEDGISQLRRRSAATGGGALGSDAAVDAPPPPRSTAVLLHPRARAAAAAQQQQLTSLAAASSSDDPAADGGVEEEGAIGEAGADDTPGEKSWKDSLSIGPLPWWMTLPVGVSLGCSVVGCVCRTCCLGVATAYVGGQLGLLGGGGGGGEEAPADDDDDGGAGGLGVGTPQGGAAEGEPQQEGCSQQ